MKKAAWFISAALSLALALPVGAQMFPDVPTDHWAYQAVANLQERGIVIGYPDGTFGGKRAMTRYEFAVATDRLIDWAMREIQQIRIPPAAPPGITREEVERMLQEQLGRYPTREEVEQRLRQLPTREDLDTIRRLVDEFREELAALGTDVEQIRRDLNALRNRVAALEERLNRVKVSGFGSYVVRGERADRGILNGVRVRRAIVDKDGRAGNLNRNLINNLKSLYTVELNVDGRVSNDVTAHATVLAGNYLPFASVTNKVGPFFATQGNFGTDSTNLTNAEVTPARLYIDGQLFDKFLFLDKGQVTVGKFGHQFTPYTLRQVDPDIYVEDPFTDNGDITITGGRLSADVGRRIHLVGYAGFHNNLIPGGINRGFPVFFSLGGPGAINPVPYTAAAIDQSAGIRGTWDLGRLKVGVTYVEAGISNQPVAGLKPGTIARGAQILGGDLSFKISNSFHIKGQFASSNLLNDTTLGDRSGVLISNLRNAWDARLGYQSGRFHIVGGWKQIDPLFGAPGFWDQIGRYKNPVNLTGFFGKVAYDFGRFSIDGSAASYNSVRDGIVGTGLVDLPGGDHLIQHYTANLKVNFRAFNGSNQIGFGWERVNWDPLGLPAKAREQYFTLSYGHQFSENTSFRLLYQIVDYADKGAGLWTEPFGKYEGGLAVSQISVRF